MLLSSNLLRMFYERELAHDCNHFVSEQAEMYPRSWFPWNGLIKIPHFWEDDAAFIHKQDTPLHDLMTGLGLKVLLISILSMFSSTPNV